MAPDSGPQPHHHAPSNPILLPISGDYRLSITLGLLGYDLDTIDASLMMRTSPDGPSPAKRKPDDETC